MRLACLLSIALCAAPAAAQSLYVLRAPLSVRGADVGELWRAPVELAGWEDATRPIVRYVDHDVRLRAAIDLDAEHSYVVVGVGRRTTVQTEAPFRIEMRAQSWAPLGGRTRGGLRIVLPEGFPAPAGVIGASIPVPPRGDPPMTAFSHTGAPPTFARTCEPIALRAQPTAEAPVWTVDAERLAVGEERGGFTRARVFVDGFVVHGWVEGALSACDPWTHEAGVFVGCGDGYGRGIVVTLPAGTELYSSRRASRPFARLRRDMVGIEPIHETTGQACSNGVCQRSPPEPRGPAQWIVTTDREDGGWLLHGWVRTPAERLSRPTDSGGGFGACYVSPSDWPSVP